MLISASVVLLVLFVLIFLIVDGETVWLAAEHRIDRPRHFRWRG
jgi:hypothetical protein